MIRRACKSKHTQNQIITRIPYALCLMPGKYPNLLYKFEAKPCQNLKYKHDTCKTTAPQYPRKTPTKIMRIMKNYSNPNPNPR